MIRLLLTAFLFLTTITTYAQSDLVVFSTNPTNEYEGGELLTFTIMVTNNGPSPASNVNTYYAIPPGLLPIPNGIVRFWWTGSNGTSGTNVPVNSTIASLGVNQTVSYTINIQIPGTFTDPLPDAIVTYDTLSDIEVVNTNGQTNYIPGTQSVYTVTVTNNGPENAANVAVNNPIPAGITNFSWTGDNGSSGTNVALNDVIASLPVGTTVTYTVTLDVPVGFTNPIVSTVTYDGVNDPTPTCDQCTDTDYPSVGTDIVIVNTDGQEVYTPGSPSVYTVTVSNNGTVAAANVNAFFTVPASVTNVTWTGSNGSSGTQANLTNNIGTLNVGQTVTYTLTVDVPAGFTGNFVVSASATTSTPETDGTCEFCTDTDYESASADIVVVNTNNQNIYTAGTTSVYTVTVTNNGPTAATNVQVDNAIPAGITNFSWVGDNGSSGINTALSDLIASLPAGDVVTYTITLDIPVGYTGLLTSETTVTSSTPDPDPSCAACVDTDSDTASADLVVTKTLASGATYTAGMDAVYTITIENMGPTEAQNVDVSDVIPAGIDPTTVTWYGSNGTSGTGNLTDNVASIAVGEVVTYQLVMPVPSNFNQTANIVNQVQVTSSTPDPNPACPDCIHTATPNPLANLVTVKSNGQSTYVAGTQTIYTITVTNPGPSDAYNVVVHDAKPYQIVLMTWIGNGASGSGTMHNTIPVLAAGESMTYEVSIEIPDDYHLTVGPLQNQVSVTSATPDPIPTCTSCTDTDQPSSNFVTVTQNRYTVEELVRDVLIGVDCVGIDNITWSTGTNFGLTVNGIGYFEGNNSSFDLQSGLILQSGNALQAGGPNTNVPPGDGTLSGGNWAGDGQLLTYMQGLGFNVANYNDATIIEFDFTPISDHMSFDFLFASEEYGTFQCSFSDAFAFFLNNTTTGGPVTNLAVIPGTTTPVAVTSIRNNLYNAGCPSANEAFFAQYNGNAPGNAVAPIDFNGQTVVMTAESDVEPGDVYHIKLVIADRNDNALDSAVFLEAGSFNIGQPVLPEDLTIANGGALCPEDFYVLGAENTEGASFTYQWEKDGELILDEFGQPVTTETITVDEPGVYTILASFVSNPDCQLEDSIRIEFQPNIEFNDPVDLTQCGDITAPMVFDLTQNTATITQGNTVLYDLIYFESMEDLEEGNPIFTPSTYEATNGQEIFVALIPYLNGCIITRSFTLNIIDCEVPLPELDPIAVCEPSPYDGEEMFDLTVYEDQLVEGLTDPLQYTITYYENEADADAAVPVPGTEIADPTAYLGGPDTIIYIRVQNNTLAEAYNTTELELIVNPQPEVILPAGPYEACVDTGYTLPALALGSYFTGTQGTGTQMNPGDIVSTSQTIYVYVVTGTAPYTCDDEDSFDVIINPLPAPPAPITDYVLCDQTDYMTPDGIEEFDLTTKDLEITGGNPDYAVSYYATPNDADQALNAIANPTTYTNTTPNLQTIYVRLENTVTTCYDVFDFDLVVTPLPAYDSAATDFYECEEVPGQADFDLHSHDSALAAGVSSVTVSYYNSQIEAEVGDPATQLPDIYVAPNGEEIWARLQSSVTGCWTAVRITLHVNPAPIAPALTALEECAFDNDGFENFDVQSVID
ncbi:choice-of-anchor L domain-containing protein, partial [Flavobacterium beibuense]|uniref:choice-of-anchor L domain-containing protein n=1 Tax=Flavobacterium beibuense TaxID=657326 RepID=UPI00101E14A2